MQTTFKYLSNEVTQKKLLDINALIKLTKLNWVIEISEKKLELYSSAVNKKLPKPSCDLQYLQPTDDNSVTLRVIRNLATGNLVEQN